MYSNDDQGKVHQNCKPQDLRGRGSCARAWPYRNLTKVRPLFTLLHRGSDNSPLLIVFSAKYIDQSNLTFMRLKVFWKHLPFDLLISVDYTPEVIRKHNNKTTGFKMCYLIWRNHDAICKLQSSYKVHKNTISNGELSDPLSDRVNRGLTLVRLGRIVKMQYFFSSYGNYVALPYFNSDIYWGGLQYRWISTVAQKYLDALPFFPMIFKLHYQEIINTSNLILMFLVWM